MRVLPFLLFIFSVLTSAFAQISFQKAIHSTGLEIAINSVVQTNDSGFAMTGSRMNQVPEIEMYQAKVDKYGNLLWAKTYGTGYFNYGLSIDRCNDGGTIIAGIDEFIASPSRIQIIKTDINGNIQWSTEFGSTNVFTDLRADCIKKCFDGSYVFTGLSWAGGIGSGDMMLTKISSGGNILFQKVYGDTLADMSNYVIQTSDSGFALVGFTESTNSIKLYLVKTNQSGDTLWTRAMSGNGVNEGLAICETLDHGYAIIGYPRSFLVGVAVSYFIKTDSLGNVEWANKFVGVGDIMFHSVGQLKDSTYFISGSTNNPSQVFLIKLSSLGDTILTKVINNANWPSYIGDKTRTTFDNGYVMTGSCITPNGNGVFVLKSDSSVSTCYTTNLFVTMTNINVISETYSSKVGYDSLQYLSNGIIEFPSDTGIYDYCDPMDIKEVTSSIIIDLYPNPAEEVINISSDEKFNKINIYNDCGALALQSFPSTNEFNIDISDLLPGIYIIKAFSEKGETIKNFLKL
jgi:hypothetical protein